MVWAGLDKAFVLASQDSPGDLAARLADALGASAAVTDQGDGRVVVRLSGSALTRTLRKLVAIDVDPAIFTPGHTAITQLAHVGVQLIADAGDAVTILLPRTFAGSVLHEIVEAGA
jgi:sarcosine oxidase subunit gamma